MPLLARLTLRGRRDTGVIKYLEDFNYLKIETSKQNITLGQFELFHVIRRFFKIAMRWLLCYIAIKKPYFRKYHYVICLLVSLLLQHPFKLPFKSLITRTLLKSLLAKLHLYSLRQKIKDNDVILDLQAIRPYTRKHSVV